jgi:HK97 family phage portal protein
MGIFNKFRKPVARKSYRTYELMPPVSWVPKWSEFSSRQAIRDGFKRSVWVYACARLRANNIASIPWIVEIKKGGDWEADPNHDLQKLIDRPNPAYDFSDMMRRAVFAMDLSGDAYLSKVRNDGKRLIEIWPLIPDKMDIYPSRDRMISYYMYRHNSVSAKLLVSDVLHLKYAHPGDLYYGLPPLQAAARAVDIDEEGEKWQKTSLQNMAVPPSAVVMEGDITQTQYDQTKQWVAEQSGPENARKPWVLANAKWQSLAQSAVDLDFIMGRKMTREEICSAFSVPPPLVGLYENATLANIQTAREILWREGLIPVLDEIQGQMNLQLASEYPEDIRITYDLSNVEALAENYTEKIDNARKLWGMGIPLSEINQRLKLGLELDKVHGADIGYLPGGLLPTDFDMDVPEPGSRAAARTAYGDET